MAVLSGNFKVDDRVVIVQTGDRDLDGLSGIILGTSSRGLTDFLIVMLDKPFLGEKAIVLPESCLERL